MYHILKITFAISIVLIFNSCAKEGCSDPLAYNYNSEATTDDGSCTFQGCTDPNAANYDSLATVSGECIYNQVGSWTSVFQEINVNITMTLLGFPLIDTTYTQTVHPDSLDPSGIDVLYDGNLIIHYNDEPSEDGTWTRTNDMIEMYFQDTSLVFNIDSVSGSFLKLFTSQSESAVDPTTGASINYNYGLVWDLNRN